MIPLVIPPLTNLRVLVTRPAQQSQSLCDAIVKLGGEVIRFPVLDIQPRQVMLSSTSYDLVIFISVNAVVHGASLLKQLNASLQVAGIGNATVNALQLLGIEVQIAASAPFNSEALLSHERLQSPPEKILLIRGVGGRELLRETLSLRGACVDIAEVYERTVAVIPDDAKKQLQQALKETPPDVVTITSMDIAQALMSSLAEEERQLLHGCTVLAGSPRIAMQLPELGWKGECVVSESPDDEAMLNALARWHTRGRN